MTRLIATKGKASKVVELRREVDALNAKLNFQAQTMLRNAVEVTGVTKLKIKTCIILMMSSLIGVRSVMVISNIIVHYTAQHTVSRSKITLKP